MTQTLQATPRSTADPQEGRSFRFQRGPLLPAVLLVDALTFLTGAALNFGAHVPLGFTTPRFPGPGLQAGTAEAIIAIALLIAGLTGSRAWAWVAFWLSLVGIGFGLSVTVAAGATGGPEFDTHVVMATLALILLALLLATRQPGAKAAAAPRGRLDSAIGALMVLAGLTLLAASAIHFGLHIGLGSATIYDPFPGARVPEAALGVVMLAGAALVFAHRAGSWAGAFATTLATLLLTAYGLSVTLPARGAGDIAYHLSLMALLVAIAALLVSPAGRRALPH